MTRLLACVLLVCALGAAGPALAGPDLALPDSPNLAQRGSTLYRFTQHDVDSADGQRHYRVWVGVPNSPPPPAGYPALYLLDGNAALASLDDALLATLGRDRLPVLVLLGYLVAARFDVQARAYDYTPSSSAMAAGQDVGRPGGGADRFARLIEQRIKPMVNALARIDAHRQTLWGHSFGGLFALHVLLTRTADFQRYALADPSVWWGHGVVLGERQGFVARRPVHLLLMRGMAAQAGKGPAGASDVPPEAARQLAAALASQPNVTVEYRERPLGHGAMFNDSLLPALRFAVG